VPASVLLFTALTKIKTLLMFIFRKWVQELFDVLFNDKPNPSKLTGRIK